MCSKYCNINIIVLDNIVASPLRAGLEPHRYSVCMFACSLCVVQLCSDWTLLGL